MPTINHHKRFNSQGEDVTVMAHDSARALPQLSEILEQVQQVIPPVWPLKDYVAVNPFVGLSGHTFLEARQILKGVRDCDTLMSKEYFQLLLDTQQISHHDIETALNQCQLEYPALYTKRSASDIVRWIRSEPDHPQSERTIHTIAETIDLHEGSIWNSHIINDISRYLSAHYDEGQALWPSPWKSLPLYDAWRETVAISQRMDHLGVRGFRHFVSSLPSSPVKAIARMLEMLEVPRTAWLPMLMCEMFSVSGWASYVRYRGWDPSGPPQLCEDLTGLLAIRMAYDVALLTCHDVAWPAKAWPVPTGDPDPDHWPELSPTNEVIARYCLQVATENAYRHALYEDVLSRTEPQISPDRPALQMVFCIDVRSEVFRRNLESLDTGIETLGFAGFFGMPFEFVPLGSSSGTAQCPVLLSPGFRVYESPDASGPLQQSLILQRRAEQSSIRKYWKLFQNSASSCFSFVESFGLCYIPRLLKDSLLLGNAISPQPEKNGHDCQDHTIDLVENESTRKCIPHSQRVQLAENFLRNLGLTDAFARIVAICGHTSDVTNNPYKAGLDCGACGGHSGEPNARVAAQLLNDPKVREDLAQRGIQIPADTWFLAAVHHTTTDEIRFIDTGKIPSHFIADFHSVQRWTTDASRLTRIERARRLGANTEAEVIQRSQDWAEVRPEWGLANNAAFIVAPRSRTAGLNLNGRTFMHNYNYRKDPELRVLELIMTAPMVVTSWINLQYYSSTVDNRAFGSGNKLIHNVVGQFGVFEGNGGDLMTGLPWQSVHDGKEYQHAPLRLLVLIEAPRQAVQQIIEKHFHVRDLVTNGWLTVTALEEGRPYEWTSLRNWREAKFSASSDHPPNLAT